MCLNTLSPWQLLLWIVCLEILSVPLIAILVNAIIVGYFKAKRDHFGKIATSFSKALEKITTDIMEKAKGENKNDDANT